MLKRLKLNKILLSIGYLFFLIGVVLIVIKLCLNIQRHYRFDIEVKNNILGHNVYNFHNINKSKIIDYIACLTIPKINLIQGLVDKNSEFNHVDKNIQIIKESNMPDIENGNLILASHSGNSNVSYFKDLDKLIINDSIYIEYNNSQYEYKIVHYYTVEKTGLVDIIRNENKNTLTLITCVENTNKQLVVISELSKINNL